MFGKVKPAPNLKPGKLSTGDKVGIFLPSSPVKDSFRQKGLAKIREMGYVPVEVREILSRHDFLAKEPAHGFSDIREFLQDKNIKALWAARGGYGSNHLLPFLCDLKIARPRIIIGSSDVSYLLWYLLDRFHMVVFYGPMVYSSLAEDRANIMNLVSVLTGDYQRLEIAGQVLKPGKVKGIVTGGCLSNFVSLIGTSYLPEVRHRVLLLEDTGERPFRLDRMFWQIFQADIFSSIKGLLLGRFPGCFKNPKEKENFLRRVQDYVKDTRIPVIYDLPFGHGEDIHTLPLGINIEIDTGNFPGIIIQETGVIC
jgi:muramoyltetrapeptide carboxypeptidase